jgi:hypothetical protein
LALGALWLTNVHYQRDRAAYDLTAADVEDAEASANRITSTTIPTLPVFTSSDAREAMARTAQAHAISDTKHIIDSLMRLGTPSVRATLVYDRKLLRTLESNPAGYRQDDNSYSSDSSTAVTTRDSIISEKSDAPARLAAARDAERAALKRLQISRTGMQLLILGILVLVWVWGSARTSKAAPTVRGS